MRSTIAQNVEREQLLEHAERVLAAFVGGINKEVTPSNCLDNIGADALRCTGLA
jgi:hypothetical protein